MIAGLVLAAGASTRMGQPKQLLPFRGGTLLGYTIAVAKSALDDVLVVLGAAADQILTEAHLHGATSVINQNYARGQASSLALGIQALAARAEVDAIVVMLGDQPTVHPEVFMPLIAAYRAQRANTVVPRYGRQIGNPVLFARPGWEVILTHLAGDRGARGLINQGRPAPLIEVAFPAEWWPDDIDTWADYRQIEPLIAPPPPPTIILRAEPDPATLVNPPRDVAYADTAPLPPREPPTR